MANPFGNGSNNNDAVDHGGSSVPETVLQHNPGVSTDWTPDEQLILEDGLTQYASETNIVCYAKIAVQLQNKTVRDVAMRCRWMVKRDISKRKKDDYISNRKSKDRKEKMIEQLASTSRLPVQTGVPSYYNGVVANGRSSSAQHSVLVSPAGQLLKESAQVLERVSANIETRQAVLFIEKSTTAGQLDLQLVLFAHENISLLCQVRKNIVDILRNDTLENQKPMPPLNVKLNEELFSTLLPHAALQQQQQMQ